MSEIVDPDYEGELFDWWEVKYHMKPGDRLVKAKCGWCDGPIPLEGLGTDQQKLKYYWDVDGVGPLAQGVLYLPFCSPDCGLMHYEKHVLKREPPDWGPTGTTC